VNPEPARCLRPRQPALRFAPARLIFARPGRFLKNLPALGRLGAQNGVDVALYAAHSYVYELGRRDCEFALVGRGDMYERMRALADELGLAEFVTMPGRIPDDELFPYLSTADLGLSPDPPSPLNDVSTMNKTMEYMAMGKAAVAFDLRESRYSAQDAAGYAEPNEVMDFSTKIRALLDDPLRRYAMGRLALRRSKDQLTWEHSRPRLLAAYAHAFRRLEAG